MSAEGMEQDLERDEAERGSLADGELQDKASGCPLGYIICLRCRQIFKHSRTSSTLVYKRHISACGKANNQPLIIGFAVGTLPNSIPEAAKHSQLHSQIYSWRTIARSDYYQQIRRRGSGKTASEVASWNEADFDSARRWDDFGFFGKRNTPKLPTSVILILWRTISRALQVHALNVFKAKLQPDDIHKVAVFLNPSMKHMSFLPESDCVKVIATVMKHVQQIEVPHDERALMPSADIGAPKPKSIFDFSNLCMFSSNEPGAQSEVEKYNRMRNPPATQDLLAFWQQNEKELPCLSLYAKRILSVPASSNPSERLFSHTGNALNSKRTSMLPKTLSDLMVIR
ncbi:hypothetical protein RvY_00031 [Ramazzottius varieornatus]|uniref:HAT C-terminal dimerisation domain-containing protein n=1 Tax=Ramazzottius varieornatus TaxID=947166 RepID=A0A1D1UFH0_RAMVA|nr:hypothetical protein RvY_00031 [Ramazzottius varieornatus]